MYRDGGHLITVCKLRELLQDSRLRDDDILIPNAVGNLAVARENEMVAYIDLGFEEHVEWL